MYRCSVPLENLTIQAKRRIIEVNRPIVEFANVINSWALFIKLVISQ